MNCTSQIRQSADLLSLSGTENGTIENKSETPRGRLQEEAKKTVRCLTVLKEYVAECDDDHAEERAILPHGRFVFSRLKQFIFRLICRDKKSWLVQWWKHLPSALSPKFFSVVSLSCENYVCWLSYILRVLSWYSRVSQVFDLQSSI